ncbi:MAG: hypothetical protein ACT4TC_03235 [Myxococcaceae bacterium]
MSVTLTESCPQCGAPADPDDFQCPRCELLLNFQGGLESEPVTEPSVVRALLAPPERKITRDLPIAPPRAPFVDGPTARYTSAWDGDAIPRVCGGVELASTLHAFEAYVVSYVDGRTKLSEMARACRISEIEAQVVLRSLMDRGVVEVRRSEDGEETRPLMRAPMDQPWSEDVVKTVQRPTLHFADLPQPKVAGARVPMHPEDITAPEIRATQEVLNSAAPSGDPTVRNVKLGANWRPGGTRQVAPMAPLERVTGDPTPSRRNGGAANVIERAVTLERRGEIDAAIHLLRQAIGGMNHPAPLYNKLALILVMQRKDLAQAEELLRKALALEPSNSIYQQNLYKVVGRAALGAPPRKPQTGGGLFARLRRSRPS